MTFSEIGAAMGISAKRANQIYLSAIRKMRRRHGVFATDLLYEIAFWRGMLNGGGSE